MVGSQIIKTLTENSVKAFLNLLRPLQKSKLMLRNTVPKLQSTLIERLTKPKAMFLQTSLLCVTIIIASRILSGI